MSPARRIASLLAVAAVAVPLAACGGGGSGGGSGGSSGGGSGGSGPDGAAVAPKSAALFLALHTALDSPAVQRLQTLAEKIPALAKALKDADLRSAGAALGSETDVVALTASDASASRFVGLTQPKSVSDLQTLLNKSDKPPVLEEIDGWQAFADTRAELDAFKSARNAGTLADDDAFKKATDGLPADQLAFAYLPGSALTELADKRTKTSMTTVPGLGRVGWLSAAVAFPEKGLVLDVHAQADQVAGLTFTPELLSKVPADAVLAVGFKGADKALDDLRRSPLARKQLQQVEAFLGGQLDDLIGLFKGEGVLFGLAGSPSGSGGLILASDDAAKDFATLDSIFAKIAPLAKGTITAAARPAGAKHLHLESGDVYYGQVGDTVALATSEDALAAVGNGPGLDSSAAFTSAREAADAPDASAGYVFVDLERIGSLTKMVPGMNNGNATTALGLFGPAYGYATVDGDVVQLRAALSVAK